MDHEHILVCFINLCYLIYLVKSWKISSVPDVYDRQCMVVPENEYSTLVTQKEGPSCPHFECWESQLTTVSKANLTWMYNQFREEIASKEGLSTVLKIAWHWSLEKEAVDIIRDCPNQLTATLETRDVAGLDYDLVCEETIAPFWISKPSQTEFINFFPSMLRNESVDLLDNFDENGYFRRPSASHFGCALMLSSEISYFVCMYCAAENAYSKEFSIQNELDECPPNTSLGKSAEFLHLCVHIFERSIYGCDPAELSYFCADENRPEIWQIEYAGNVKEWYAVFDGKETMFVVNGTGEGGILDRNVLTCKELLKGRCPPPLSSWNFVYDDAKLLELNRTMYQYSEGKYIRFSNNNVVSKIGEVKEIVLLPAGCCIYMFYLFLLTAILTIVILYFTYKHRKENKG